MERLLANLQARRIDRIAAGYAVCGWLLVQAASIAMPSFDAPPWAMRALIIFVLTGFPCSLALAWFAVPHLTPQGRGARRHVHLAALAMFAGVAVFAVGGLAYQLSHSTAASPPILSAQPAPASIAVLPFVNMSGDASKEYFSDGISEELLNDLANIPALRVAARTSSFAFKGRNEDIKTIARLLSVGAVLEGSVRESGAHLRITAQLIDAASGYHLWSAIYDRNLTDVLVLQDEIARAITGALTHRLLPAPAGPKPGKPHAMDAVAYRDFLQGQHDLGPRTEEGAESALVLFEQATARAPDFAEGFAALARAAINVFEYHPERKDLMPAAEAALARALALDPHCVSALASRLDLALHKLDWPAAAADAKRLVAINAHSVNVQHEMFRYYQLLGFPERALTAAQGAAVLDPLSFVDHLNVAAAYIHLARFNDAADASRAALALVSDQPDVLALLCTSEAHLGHLSEARTLEVRLAHDPGAALGCAFDIALGAHRVDEADAIMDRLARSFPQGDLAATDIGDMYAVAGDSAKAVAWLTRAYDLKEFALFTVAYDRAIAPEFFAQPGWKALSGRPLFQAWHAAHDRLAEDLSGGGFAD